MIAAQRSLALRNDGAGVGASRRRGERAKGDQRLLRQLDGAGGRHGPVGARVRGATIRLRRTRCTIIQTSSNRSVSQLTQKRPVRPHRIQPAHALTACLHRPAQRAPGTFAPTAEWVWQWRRRCRQLRERRGRLQRRGERKTRRWDVGLLHQLRGPAPARDRGSAAVVNHCHKQAHLA